MSAEAIRKLRINFIFLSMLSFILVMLFTGGMINVANNLKIRHDMEEMLDYIIASEGELSGPEEEETAASFLTDDEENDSVLAHSALLEYAPEFQYSARYFAVLYNEKGYVEDVKLSHIHSVDHQGAVEAADLIQASRASFGTYGEYFYYKKAGLAQGGTIIVVLDASTLINLNRNIIRSTVHICAVGLLLTFLAVIALSGTIIRPEIENARRQKMFITNASHELKTPLAVIRANTELEEMINGETEWTQSTLRQVDRLNGLIQNLVMIARAQEAEDPGSLGDINASEAILDSVRAYESLARQEEKMLTLDIVPDIHMAADESRIRQLATILVDNAFKYCDERGEVQVAFSKARIGRQLRLTVSNSYAAGKDVDYSRFFERFYREDRSHNADGEDRGGYGIGLSIAESICTQYKGSIRVAWKDGIITFTCLLGG
ncbi:MAG: HAMP domain-containing sensor histidine kinase [Eubacteriales bacterium]|nr:HAMP domain-containing sensor histidine kinase [Eubacteriales bacterium]